MAMQSRHDLLQRKRYLDDVLFMENVAGMSHVLENFDIQFDPRFASEVTAIIKRFLPNR
jgi:hypothetical protein